MSASLLSTNDRPTRMPLTCDVRQTSDQNLDLAFRIRFIEQTHEEGDQRR